MALPGPLIHSPHLGNKQTNICLSMHVCVCVSAHAMVVVWRSEGNLCELALSFTSPALFIPVFNAHHCFQNPHIFDSSLPDCIWQSLSSSFLSLDAGSWFKVTFFHYSS